MIIEFSDHANNTLKERKIPKNRVLKTISKPEEILSSFRGRKLYRKKFHGKILEVVIVKEEIKNIVVTEYYLKK